MDLIRFQSQDRLSRANKSQAVPNTIFYSRLIEEINEIGWSNLAYINHELNALHVKIRYKTILAQDYQYIRCHYGSILVNVI